MALMRDGPWDIVSENESAPAEEEAAKYSKFMDRRDRALATIVLSIDPSLLYLIGDPDDPSVWEKRSDQYQKKSWANELALRRKLYSSSSSSSSSLSYPLFKHDRV